MTPIESLLRRARRVRTADGEVASPCVAVCRIGSSTALCEGCFRTLREIADWSRMSDADKCGVWARVEVRANEALA